MDTFVAFILAMLIFVGGPIMAIVGLMWLTNGVSCHATGAAMHVPASYSIWTDCMVTIKGQTIPLSAYKVVGVQ